MFTADLTIETRTDTGEWEPAVHLTDTLVDDEAGPVTLRALGVQALRAARFYRQAYHITGPVRARMEAGEKAVTAYAEQPEITELPLAQYNTLATAYGRGVALVPDGDPDAEALTDLGLLRRVARVSLRGTWKRQYVTVGPFAIRWFAYRNDEQTADGWAPLANGTVYVPAGTQEMLDRVTSIIAATRAHDAGSSVRVVATVEGTALTAFEDATAETVGWTRGKDPAFS